MDDAMTVDLPNGKAVLVTSREVFLVRGLSLTEADLRATATGLVAECVAKGALVRALDDRRLELEAR